MLIQGVVGIFNCAPDNSSCQGIIITHKAHIHLQFMVFIPLYKGCPESIQPLCMSQEPVAWQTVRGDLTVQP